MTDDQTPEAIVESTLTMLVSGTRQRDLAGVLDLFLDDAALFGSDEGEFACGRDDLRPSSPQSSPSKSPTVEPGTTRWPTNTAMWCGSRHRLGHSHATVWTCAFQAEE
jgi:hypothetical protein